MAMAAESVHPLVLLFARAFDDDPLNREFLPDDTRRARALAALFRFELATAPAVVVRYHGLVAAAAIWREPGSAPISIGRQREQAWLFASIRLPALVRLWRYHRFAERLRSILVPEPHWYLAAVAVANEHRGRGFASRVIRPTLERADETGTPCYLETQNPNNVPRYEHYGFSLAVSPLIPGTRLRHFTMVRR